MLRKSRLTVSIAPFFVVAAIMVLSATPTHAQACPDVDLDGYADCTVPGCDPTGLMCGDCDDGDGAIHPAAVEICNQIDDDCDGVSDNGFAKPLVSMSVQDTANDRPSDDFGRSVAGLGDVTGDDVEDFAVGIPNYDIPGGFTNVGSVLVYSGADRTIHCRATDPAAASSDTLGNSVAAIGDLTGDGIGDFVTGSHLDDTAQGGDRGSVLLFNGATCAFVRKMTDTSTTGGFTHLGFSVVEGGRRRTAGMAHRGQLDELPPPSRDLAIRQSAWRGAHR